MDRYLEAFEAGERARIAGDNEAAVEHYADAALLLDESSAADPVALHHMWGVTLINLGQYEEADEQLGKAIELSDDPIKTRAIDRDAARCALLNGDFGTAHELIGYAMGDPTDDIAERGASMGFLARILLAEGKPEEALEIFGMADVLLQRSGNHHYELYNLMHFLEALAEHETPFILDDQPDVIFAEAQAPRLKSLAETYGGTPHRDRAERIIDKIFAEREA